MTREEATKLLALIKVAYPTSYRDMDGDMIQATVNMWQSSFPSTPFAIMQLAFDRYRRVSKFPPTVAEITDELSKLYWIAVGEANIAKTLGDKGNVKRCAFVMDHTYRFIGDTADVGFDSISDEMLLEHEKRLMLGDGGYEQG